MGSGGGGEAETTWWVGKLHRVLEETCRSGENNMEGMKEEKQTVVELGEVRSTQVRKQSRT